MVGLSSPFTTSGEVEPGSLVRCPTQLVFEQKHGVAWIRVRVSDRDSTPLPFGRYPVRLLLITCLQSSCTREVLTIDRVRINEFCNPFRSFAAPSFSRVRGPNCTLGCRPGECRAMLEPSSNRDAGCNKAGEEIANQPQIVSEVMRNKVGERRHGVAV